MPRLATATRKCEECGVEFTPRRHAQIYDSPKCRFTAANHRKTAQRQADTLSTGCSVPECIYRSPLGRFYRHTEDGRTVMLCGLHHTERYRPESSDGDVALATGRYYQGYFHVSTYDLKREPISDDGGIGQLIDHLSGEMDSGGSRTPHPFVSRQVEDMVYAARSV